MCLKKFSRFIVNHPAAVLAAGVLVFLAALYGMSFTKINYDILNYLPGDLSSVQGENILDKSFKTAGSALLLTDVTDMERVRELKSEIEKIKGVESVLWLDNAVDPAIPLRYLSEPVKEPFIKGKATLMTIQFEKSASSQTTFEAVDRIRALLDSKSRFGGMAALLNDLRHLMDHEKLVYILVAVALIFILLSVTLDSFAISILFLISIGMAIALNMGTNFLRGNISYITSAIASVLQLGVTMDFSIFLYHRYEQERRKLENKQEAMAKAMCHTSVAVFASALATAAGFLALLPMKIKIGEDIGIVLAKGVIIGVITAMTILPALLMLSDGIIEKTRHKPLLPGFKVTSGFVAKHYRVIFAVFLLLFIPAYFGKTHSEIFYNIMDALPADMQSMKSTNTIKDTFGISEVIYLVTDRSESRLKEESLMKELEGIGNIKSTQGIGTFADACVPESFLPEKLKNQFERDQYRYIRINLKTKAAEDSTNRTIDKIEGLASKYYADRYYLCGEAVLTRDLIKLTDKDIKVVDIISIGAIFVILLIAFRSASLPVILVGVIELAIFINLGIPYYTHTSIPFIASMTVGAIQLGSTVNYSILMVTRYREELQGNDRLQAMKNAIVGSGPSIVTSALTLAAATLGVGYVSKIKMIGQFAMMIGRGTLISFVCILLALPAVLLVFDGLIGLTTLKWKGTQKNASELEF